MYSDDYGVESGSDDYNRSSSNVNNGSANNYNDTTSDKPSGCCGRFCSEFTVPMFGTDDPPTGKTIDLEASFGAQGSRVLAVAKMIVWGLIVHTLVWSWIDGDDNVFYLAYFTHWGLIVASIYESISLLISMGLYARWFFSFVWVVFPLVATSEIIIVIVYWVSVYDPEENDVKYLNLMKHGAVLLFVLVDGLVLNHTPVRLKHMIFSFFFAASYLSWTAIHAYVVKKNPDADEDDESIAIYSVIDWQADPVGAGIFTAIILAGCVPILYLLIWMLSLCGRKYKE